MINLNWPDFYDPDFYESEIGPGLRVGTAYADLLSDQVYHSVAELGCGPGAIVIELAKRGLHVKGIDRSPAMLERARLRASSLEPSVRDRIQFIEGLLEDFSLEEPVDAVLMTNELVLHLTETESLVGAFNCSRLSLVPGGRLMLDLPKIDWQALAAAIGKGGDAVNCRGFFLSPSKDFTIRVVEQLRFDPEKCHVSKMFCYEQIGRAHV